MSYGSEWVKKRREDFKARDPEGYRKLRKEESRKHRLKYPEREALRNWKGNMRRLYGLTADKWDEIFESQGRVCAMCGLPPDPNERLSVDHDHVTKKVRSLVHKIPCNVLIGYIEKHGSLVDAAIKYVVAHKE